jgi:formylglycine-generating enzyme required for sulfatase activity
MNRSIVLTMALFVVCLTAFAGAEAGNYRQGLAGAWLLADSTSRADEFVNSVGVKMVKIGPGSFEMGSTLGRDYWDEQPVHKVTI